MLIKDDNIGVSVHCGVMLLIKDDNMVFQEIVLFINGHRLIVCNALDQNVSTNGYTYRTSGDYSEPWWRRRPRAELDESFSIKII